VVTDLGVWHFDETGEMRLDAVHPGVGIDDIRASVAWEPRLAPTLGETPPPTPEELRIIREELDPEGAYTR
jgi:glutaconate CoA-transferase subunit B